MTEDKLHPETGDPRALQAVKDLEELAAQIDSCAATILQFEKDQPEDPETVRDWDTEVFLMSCLQRQYEDLLDHIAFLVL